MLWRVRTTLPDRPGALAALASRCGERDVNILSLQVFPGVGGVTDELVLVAPDGWSLPEVAALVEDAGGTRVSIGRCTEQALADGPTRYLAALSRAVHGGEPVPVLLARLLDAELAPDPASRFEGVQDTLRVGAGERQVVLRRTTPFTPTEHARAAAFVEAAAELRGRSTGAAAPEEVSVPVATTAAVVVRPATLADTGALMQMHTRCSAETVQRHFAAPMARLDVRLARRLLVGGDGALVAEVDGRIVGLASLGTGPDGTREASLVVEDGWQRRGIGSRLLGWVARLAAGLGIHDVVLRGPADSPAAIATVFSTGLRARVRLAGDELLVTVSTRGLRALAPAGADGDGDGDGATVLHLPAPRPAPSPA